MLGEKLPLLNGRQDIPDPALDLYELGLQGAADRVVPLHFTPPESCVDNHADHLVCEDLLPGEADDLCLDPVLLDWLLVTGPLPLPLDAVIIIKLPAAFPGAALAHHGAATVAAEQLPGQNIVHVRPRRSGRPGDLLDPLLHLVEQLPRYYRRDPALDPDVPPLVDACIPLVFEYGVQAVFIPPGALRRPEAAGIQLGGDLGDVLPLGILVEDLPDDLSAGGLDRIAAVRPLHEPDREAAVVYFTGQGVLAHTPEDILGQVCGVILGGALQDGLEQDPLRTLRDRLHDGHDLHSGLLQSRLIHGRVVSVPGKAVDLIDEHPLPLPLRRVFDHLEELRPLVRGAGDRPVAVLADDLQIMFLGILSADAELLLDARVLLGVGGVPGVNDGPHGFQPRQGLTPYLSRSFVTSSSGKTTVCVMLPSVLIVTVSSAPRGMDLHSSFPPT